MLDASDITALATAADADPFALRGRHVRDGVVRVTVVCPGASAVAVIGAEGAAPQPLERVHAAGVFHGTVAELAADAGYRLQVRHGEHVTLEDDAYRFGPLLGELDAWLIAEGRHLALWRVLGAHPDTLDGCPGCRFAVWAPGARRVAVIGDFNHWDARRHPMRRRPECGVWEIFVPGVGVGTRYKYEVLGDDGQRRHKADPLAFAAELRPATASVVATLPPPPAPLARPAGAERPLAIYEVHAASWQRAGDGAMLDWDALAARLVPYVTALGFTHLELLPVMEHPFDGSWGYQPTGLFAPTARHGDPAGFARFVARCHEAGLGVLLDWVPGHFPDDDHGLARFDGTCLYEHADPRQGVHRDWDTLIYNYGRHEVANFLLANALFWLECYGVDGLRVDAVASMLYLDYSREPGDWIPNRHGGRENLEAVDFIERLNRAVTERHPAALTIAEESTAWPGVSRAVGEGGLGFAYKWNMGWMHDTLAYMRRDPVHRRYHHDELTFGLLYAFSERFVLPLSHDEVVHGKGSLVGKMPGDRWQQFANLRLYFGFMWAHPGKKLLFMGGEFAQPGEWQHDHPLDWQAAARPEHAGIARLIGDLNRLYRELPALHAGDAAPDGFAWIDCDDHAHSVLAFRRRAGGDAPELIAVCNFTPVVRPAYRLGVPAPGRYREVLNSDSRFYGGSDVGNGSDLVAAARPAQGQPCSLDLTLPPLACIWLQPAC
ncbi:MAG: 1,4-alpha-glucan branching protein GlgB [Gammaproteobacteria bacterium]|nr:1,4-alpha-glucan branching protein GlgB [Gammaproteobacteria bacterium]MCP5199052.1 1,4-alpha-glucan branching protein GlgB [Gammaproteobacteria bacterium]